MLIEAIAATMKKAILKEYRTDTFIHSPATQPLSHLPFLSPNSNTNTKTL